MDDLAEPDDPATRAILDRYVAAFEGADATALAALLRHDVEIEMPPNLTWFAGRDTVVAFMVNRVFGGPGHWRMTPVRANGQWGLASYARSAEGCLRAHGVSVLDIVDGQVARVVAFNDARMVLAFGLPAVLDETLSR